MELRGIFFAVAAGDGLGVVEFAGLGHFVAATAHQIDGYAAEFGEDGVGLVGPLFEGDLGGVALVGVGAVDTVGGVGAEGVAEGVGAAARLDGGLDGRALVALGGEVTVKTVGEPVGRAVEIDVDGREDGALVHLVGVALDGFVGGLDARLRAAVKVDQVEGKFLGVHGKKGR